MKLLIKGMKQRVDYIERLISINPRIQTVLLPLTIIIHLSSVCYSGVKAHLSRLANWHCFIRFFDSLFEVYLSCLSVLLYNLAVCRGHYLTKLEFDPNFRYPPLVWLSFTLGLLYHPLVQQHKPSIGFHSHMIKHRHRLSAPEHS